jgi:phosphoribosylanthranilate isomerase
MRCSADGSDMRFLELPIYFSGKFGVRTLGPNSICTMALKTFVKLNSITNLTDARYGSGMYVNLLGFDLDKSSATYVSPDLFKEITGWVSGVDFVGEFTGAAPLDLLKVIKDYPSITWIECGDFELLKPLIGTDYSLIYTIKLEDLDKMNEEMTDLISRSGIVVHIRSEEDELSEIDQLYLKRLTPHCKVILGTGITEENILDLVDDTGIFGISLSGGEELKPGLKDLNELADILEKLETEE